MTSEQGPAHEGHDHDAHDEHAHDPRGASKRSLVIALTLISSFMVVELVGSILSGSLALAADAAHMLTDGAAIALALFAMWMANKPASAERTFGYHRTEVLAALLNTLSLWLIAGWIFFEAYHRFSEPPEVEGVLLLSVGAAGLLVNIVAAWVLHRASGESLNVEGAFQHVMADLLGSIGVVVSGVLVLSLNWWIVDPILSVGIGLLILKSSWGLFMRVFKVLLEGTPEHVDISRLCGDMEDVQGVNLVHDLHAWTITSGYNALTAHVLVDPAEREHAPELLSKLRKIGYGFGLTHITLQLEYTAAECTQENHRVGHLAMRARA